MSGATVGALNVKLSADTAAFSDGMKQVQSSLSKVAEGMQAWGARLSKSITAPLATAATTIGTIVTLMAGGVKELKKNAQVSNADIESFQRLAFAAKSVGMEGDKLADIFKDVNDKVGEFRQTGGGEMKDFFEQIAPKVGITAEAFKNLSGPEALQLYYNSLEKAGLSQQEIVFYMEAIADEATALIPLLRENGKTFAELGQGAAVMSPTAIAAFDQYNAAVTRLTEAVRGLVIAFAESGLLDAMTAIVSKVAEWINAIAALDPYLLNFGVAVAAIAAALGPAMIAAGLFAAALAPITGTIVLIIGGIAALVRAAQLMGVDMESAADFVRAAWHRMGQVFPALEVMVTGFTMTVQNAVAAAAAYVIDFANEVIAKINAVIQKINAIPAAFGAANIAEEFDPVGSGGWAKTIEDNAKRAEHAYRTALLKLAIAAQLPAADPKGDQAGSADAIKRMGEEVKVAGDKAASGGAKAAGGARAAKDAVRDLAEEGARLKESLRTPVEVFNDEMQRLKQLLQAGAVDWETYSRAVKKAEEDLASAKDTTSGMAGVFDGLGQEISGGLTNALMSFIEGSKSAADAVKDLARTLLSSLLNRTIQTLMDQLLNSLAKAFGGMGASGAAWSDGSSLGLDPNGPVATAARTQAVPQRDVDGAAGPSVEIHNNTGQPATARSVSDGMGGRRMEVVIGEAVAGEARRAGSSVDQAFRARYGVTPALTRR